MEPMLSNLIIGIVAGLFVWMIQGIWNWIRKQERLLRRQVVINKCRGGRMQTFGLVNCAIKERQRSTLPRFFFFQRNFFSFYSVLYQIFKKMRQIRLKLILSCGNGGSLCDAMHLAEELSGKFRKNRPALPALCLSNPAHITCVANDFGYKYHS